MDEEKEGGSVGKKGDEEWRRRVVVEGRSGGRSGGEW